MTDLVERNRLALENIASFHRLGLQPLGNDLALGVREITRRVHGTDDGKAVRSMFNILEKSNTIPWFKLGSRTCVQMSSLRAKIWSQEKRAWASHEQELLVRTHILLSAALPLLAGFSGKRISDGDLKRLIAVTAEAVQTMERVLKAEGA
jgi:hypothetical protein